MAESVVQDDQLVEDAVALIQQSGVGYDESYGASFMSCAIYHTAWVSMVVKDCAGEKKWLFPQSFDYLIRTQADDGSWRKTATASQIDIILNTASSLLSAETPPRAAQHGKSYTRRSRWADTSSTVVAGFSSQ
ncbi:hypothetical protein F4779DRAFT_624275 [Xylariaceae sp. FL0662B]|nr:hypothetical protein F4779DRAFT_624275 [Xylariaceae sp. FL0662B]